MNAVIKGEIKKPEPVAETPINELTWEQLMNRRETTEAVLDNLKAEMQVISDECLYRLQEEKTNGKIVGDYTISKKKDYSFSDTPLEWAKEMGAVSETKDRTKLRALYEKGIQVPGAKFSEGVMIRRINKEKETQIKNK